MSGSYALSAFVAAATFVAGLTSAVSIITLANLRASIGLVLCLAGFVLETVMPSIVLVQPMGIQIYLTDAIYIMLAAAAIFRWLHIAQHGRPRPEVVALFALAALMLIGFARGAAEFGPQDAGVEFRRYFFFLTGTAYFASFEATVEWLGWLLRAWLITSLVVILISIVRFSQFLGGFDVTLLRVIDSNATLFLSQALIMCLYLWIDSKNKVTYRNLALFIFPFVIVMQHRTVWIVLAVTLLVVLLWEGRIRRRLLSMLAVCFVLASVAVLLVYGGEGANILSTSASDSNTFDWRVEGWGVLVKEQIATVPNIVAGRPLGGGFERYLPSRGYFVDVMPHNYYIEVFYVGGILGLLLLLLMYWYPILRGVRLATSDPQYYFGHLGVVLVVSQLVYFLTYAPRPEQSVVLGAVMSLAVVRSRHRREPPREA